MEYKISVPVINDIVERNGREKVLEALRSLDAQRVFLAMDCYELDDSKRRAALDSLRENCKYFHSKGLEVGAWIWAFMFKEKTTYHPITMVSEQYIPADTFACPADRDFLKYSGEYIADIARCGVDMIMFDDDLRMGFLAGHNAGCLCELHRKMICDAVGEELSREELARLILKGGKNRYRAAWLEANKQSFESFAENARSYVDSVDPRIRLGACACLSSYDVDGTDVGRMARIMAGSTRPFARLIGAPYWAAKNPGSWGNTLADVIELERMESSWIDDPEIEIFAEGDTYPRPRFNCPARYLECFDTAIRASGAPDGILKYGIDYVSSTDYERGYIQRHIRNRSVYSDIDRLFEGGSPVGVRIYEKMKKVAEAELDGYRHPEAAALFFFFSGAARLLDVHGIPSTYEGKGAFGIAFGENVKYLSAEERCGGLVIDGTAAVILHKQGVDVGIEELGGELTIVTEHFADSGETVNAFGAHSYAHKFKARIKVLSVGSCGGGFSLMGGGDENNGTVMSYLYENEQGERYLVLNINMGNCTERSFADIKNIYPRGAQIAEAAQWLSGRSLPAYCGGNPFTYLLAKECEDGLAVGVWNLFADEMIEPVVELGEHYSSIEASSSTCAVLEGNRVRLSDIQPYSFAFFKVKK